VRAAGLRRLRRLLLSRLPELDPALPLRLPGVPRKGSLKPVEDRIDAVFCAYLAAYWWHWAEERNRVYGSGEAGGYIVVPAGTRTRNHTVISE
jgi:predicted RNase H-like nuclease